LTQFYAPLGQQLMAQGGQFNLQNITNLFAEMLNLPQLKECVQFVNPVSQGDEEDSTPAPMNTTRTYQRNSVAAGPTPQMTRGLGCRQHEWKWSRMMRGAMQISCQTHRRGVRE
jgi:hypothetical protein